MSFFKKKDEDRKEAYEPSDDNVSAKEGSSGGKGGGEPAAPSVDPSTKAGKSAINKSMDDGRFGYGYIDRNTGVEVPWYIDMINGGGANAAGDTFVSPFAELPFGGGMASMPTNLANAAGIAPYGYNQPRRYAQAGMQGYPTAAPAPRPTGGGSPTAATPTFVSAPTTDVSIGQGNTTPLSYGDQRPPEAIGINEILQNRNRGFHPTISPLTMPAASVPSPNYATYVGKPVTQIETYPSMFSNGVNTDFSPAYDPAMFGSDITASTDVGRRRMDNLNTIPATSVGTKEARSYEEYLRAGGQLLFPEYVSALGQ